MHTHTYVTFSRSPGKSKLSTVTAFIFSNNPKSSRKQRYEITFFFCLDWKKEINKIMKEFGYRVGDFNLGAKLIRL